MFAPPHGERSTAPKSINFFSNCPLIQGKIKGLEHFLTENFGRTRVQSRPPLENSLQRLDFVDRKSGLRGNQIQRNVSITETLGHSLFLFQRLCFGLLSPFFPAFVKIKFVSHIFIPYESIGRLVFFKYNKSSKAREVTEFRAFPSRSGFGAKLKSF